MTQDEVSGLRDIIKNERLVYDRALDKLKAIKKDLDALSGGPPSTRTERSAEVERLYAQLDDVIALVASIPSDRIIPGLTISIVSAERPE